MDVINDEDWNANDCYPSLESLNLSERIKYVNKFSTNNFSKCLLLLIYVNEFCDTFYSNW